EQRIFVEIPDRLDLTELREQGRARHGEHPIVEHLLRAQIRPAAAAVAHGGMKVRLHEIDELTARAEAKVDTGMLLVEVAEARQQPLLKKQAEQADVEQPGAAILPQLIHGASQLAESTLYARQKPRALRREPDRSA